MLELPEDYFVSRHLYDDKSEDHLRYMIYHPRTLEEDAKVQNTWSRSHTDFGSLTSPYGITAGPDGNLWFSETGNGKIGRIVP